MTDDALARYKNPDNDPRGLWKSDPATAQAGHATKSQFYTLIAPNGRKHEPPSGRCWLYSADAMKTAIAEGRIWFGEDGNNVPRIKTYLTSKERGLNAESIWFAEQTSTNESAKNDLKALFDGIAVFDTPKPTELIAQMLRLASPEGIVLDFFAGSGTTGHAVMAQTATDQKPRCFICVQLPEPLSLDDEATRAAADFCNSHGLPRLISELTKERLRRAARKVRIDNPLFAGDLGFRVFKLDSSNIRTWEPRRDDLGQTLIDNLEHLKSGRTEQDILYELLLKLGLDLCVPIEQKSIAGKTVHSIGGGVLFACLGDKIGVKDVEPLALGIVEWRKALAPAGESTCVLRDSAFANDVAKTNLAAILEQHGIEKVRSL
jgi:adenine-specific DNA-methyltransferase